MQVNTDSSTARSISSRKGDGQVRHVKARELWVQEKVRREELSIDIVRGEDIVADGFTKHVDRSKLEEYMSECGFPFRDGRHEFCLHLGDV